MSPRPENRTPGETVRGKLRLIRALSTDSENLIESGAVARFNLVRFGLCNLVSLKKIAAARIIRPFFDTVPVAAHFVQATVQPVPPTVIINELPTPFEPALIIKRAIAEIAIVDVKNDALNNTSSVIITNERRVDVIVNSFTNGSHSLTSIKCDDCCRLSTMLLL